jgi:hypothetical protein
MRNGARVAAVLTLLACAPGARAADPATVYNDYASDKVLSCNYSRADLQAVLNDATLSQYGDPYTLVGLKLAVRKQLAGACKQAVAGEGKGDGDGASQDGRLRLLGVGLLLLVLATAGWAVRRGFSGRQ